MHAEGKNQRKWVRRIYSDRYVLITLISFAVSVSLIRFFLGVTGYPQIGSAELHFAHVLWGGLLLFISSLLPLIFVNKRILDLSALLSGIGVGLFIDEVGKFITQTNDYFYPAAAPIIYVFFLLTIQVYRMIRKPLKKDLRTNLYHTLEEFEEVLEGDLSDKEKAKIIHRMEALDIEKEDQDLLVLKEMLILFLKDPTRPFVKHIPDFYEKAANWFGHLEEKVFHKVNFRIWLRAAWFVLGFILIAQSMFIVTGIDDPIQLSGVLKRIADSSLLRSENINVLGLARIILQLLSGICLCVSAFFYNGESRYKWVQFVYLVLLIVLTVVNSLVFFYDQFSTIIFVLLEFSVFYITTRYLNWQTNYFSPDS